MQTFEIKSSYTGQVIYSTDCESLRECVECAIKEGANLRGANLYGACLPHFQIVPDFGPFCAYKKLSRGVIVRVLIPGDAKRTSTLVGRKCRASHVKIIEVVENPFDMQLPIGSTHKGSDVPYQVGETFYADEFDDDIRVECAHGIHFFMTLKEAQNWC